VFKINIAARSCPKLWVQAPIIPTKGREKRSFFREKAVKVKLKIVPERLMKKADEKKPVLKKATSKSLVIKKARESLKLKFKRIRIVTILAKPNFAPGMGKRGGKKFSKNLKIRAIVRNILR
jgi:hypothetical protein